LDEEDITEVMVNGPNKVYIEKKGKLTKTNITFENDEQVMRLIDRIISPWAGASMQILPPWMPVFRMDRVSMLSSAVAIDGPTITIRKIFKGAFIGRPAHCLGSMTRGTAEFIRACVVAA